MKFRHDHVTNSSSASFILTLKANEPIDLDVFEGLIAKYLKHMEAEYERLDTETNVRFYNASHIQAIDDQTFVIVEDTSMYNDIFDIPEYIRFMAMESVLHNGFKHMFGFEIESFEVDNHN